MEIVLRRYGNSTVAVFPPTVLKDLGLSAGQSMIMNTTEDGKIVLARKRKYILADLDRNSTVAVFPPTVLKDLGLSAGQSMIMNTTEDGKIVLARKRKYILADLLAQCDPKVPPPADMGLWDAAKPAGQEVW